MISRLIKSKRTQNMKKTGRVSIKKINWGNSMKKSALIATLLTSFLSTADYHFKPSHFDFTIVSQIRWAGGLERLPILLTRLFKNEMSMNLIPTPGLYTFTDIPQDEQIILKNPDKTPGNVAILFDVLWHERDKLGSPADFVPNTSIIKIAYSMLEGTAIPKTWADILNKKFDLVAVPDEYYQTVYQNSGVTIPIFVLPHGIDIQEFLNQPIRMTPSKPFVFGSSAAFISRKNHETLINAFHAEFKNDPRVRLKIHGRDGRQYKALQNKVKKLKTKNINLVRTPLSWYEYRLFMQSLDCYVLLSKGEGFSITPREALALGKPCIISDNTAHHTIAQTGFVYAVPSTIQEPADYDIFAQPVGYNFNCSIADVQKALREVYTHYQLYVEKAKAGRKWVERYLWENVQAKFRNLLKPTNVLFGPENRITDEYIMTNNTTLYEKYLLLQKNSQISLDVTNPQ